MAMAERKREVDREVAIRVAVENELMKRRYCGSSDFGGGGGSGFTTTRSGSGFTTTRSGSGITTTRSGSGITTTRSGSGTNAGIVACFMAGT